MNAEPEYIAHIVDRDQPTERVQTLKSHLLNTCKYAEQFAKNLGLSHVAGLVGILHDFGKYRAEFQEYIKSQNGVRGSVDHSSYGAIFFRNYISDLKDNNAFLIFGEIIENCILSHHNSLGLKDDIDENFNSPFLNRFRGIEDTSEVKELEKIFYADCISKIDFDNYVQIAFNEFKEFTDDWDPGDESYFFLENYIFSCLIDADRTDAATFWDNNSSNYTDNNSILSSYYDTLISKLTSFKNDSELNKNRSELSKICDKRADDPDGVYTLSAATGAGKTLSSLRYSLKHAKRYGKQRIIYVLPFITIIEQNSNVFREFLNGDKTNSDNILEFHSNVVQDENKTEQSSEFDLVEDSWDSPIVVTTMVQFLNTIFAKGTKNRRRYHNLFNSVIVFDEVQKVPTKCTSMFVQLINFLANHGKSNVLLCTATQPDLNEVGLQLSQHHELIPDLSQHIKQFKRVKFVDNSKQFQKSFSASEIGDQILKQTSRAKSILAIFNTIKATDNAYKHVKENNRSKDTHVYCLTTHMCPKHRSDTLNQIFNDLGNPKIKVICVTTPLIEAGVDISFECVYRSYSGLDSIIQAAGRCNRNGESRMGEIVLNYISQDDEYLNSLDDIRDGRDQVEEMIVSGMHADDMSNPKNINQYFDGFFKRAGSRKYYSIKGSEIKLSDCISGIATCQRLCYSGIKNEDKKVILSFIKLYNSNETIAKNFHVIDQDTYSVICEYDRDATMIISKLNDGKAADYKSIFKHAQRYMINIYPELFRSLCSKGAIKKLQIGKSGNDAYYLTSDGYTELTMTDVERQSYIF